MRQYMKKLMMAAALLLTTTGMWADRHITINVLPELQSGNAGSVIYFIDNDNATDEGTPIRLEVMPTEGYMASLENISVELKVEGNVAQTPRRTPGLMNVEVSATDPEADPSGETWYSFVVPNDETYDVEITVNFQQRTSIADAVVELLQYTFVYDGEAKTPTTTVTLGDDVLTEGVDYSVAYANNTEVGTATVTVTGTRTYTGTATAEFTISYFVYDLKVNGMNVSDGNLEDVLGDGGTVKFDPESNMLTLSGLTATATGKPFIESGLESLVIALSGDNVITMAADELNQMPVQTAIVSTYNDADVSLTFQKAEGATDGQLRINTTEGFTDGFLTPTCEDALILQALDGYYLVSRTLVGYSITITPVKGAAVVITAGNSPDVLGDGTVSFDGDQTLKLMNANVKGITVNGTYAKDKLTIELVGNDTIQGANYVVSNNSAALTELIFITNQNESGKLFFERSGLTLSSDAFYGIATIRLKNNLIADVNNGVLTILVPLPPAVANATDGSQNNAGNIINFANSLPISTMKLINKVIQEVLYTLNDTQETNQHDDGFVDNFEDGDGFHADIVVINSTMTDNDVKTVSESSLTPGSKDYAEQFQGLTLLLPKGKGNIYLTNVYTDDYHYLTVAIGNFTVPYKFCTHGKFIDQKVPYEVPEDTYVYIYVTEIPSAAPMMASNRIGPKAGVSGGLGGLSVSASSVETVENNTLSISNLSPSISGNVFVLKDATIKSIEAGTFNNVSQDLAYIDLSGTGITNMTSGSSSPAPAYGRRAAEATVASRSAGGAFEGVDYNTIIYLPAGNESDDDNVVIGTTCKKLVLDGNGSHAFSVAKNFTATKAILNRSFTSGKRSTVFLPFDVPQATANSFGSFYEFESIVGTTVNMVQVTTGGLKACKPYIFIPDGTIDKLEINDASVKAGTVNSECFIGTYEEIMWPVDQEKNYCFVGEEKGGFTIGMFAQMGAGSIVPPFRAYMRVQDAPARSLDIVWHDGEEATGIVTVKDGKAERTVTSNGWYTLNGLQMDGTPVKKGLYIHNGKKEIVK